LIGQKYQRNSDVLIPYLHFSPKRLSDRVGSIPFGKSLGPFIPNPLTLVSALFHENGPEGIGITPGVI